ncbi:MULTISPECIES: PucR family transcriptional regulator [Clostridium]|uniref:PucR family transcriptional regulator n=1 Tax=Clostridium TaxID=1485 RepID=UPI00082634B1|nr:MULTISPECIES: PucR family transcriptional regulator ligand-binding domain-containing protein [Clostridium]PJI08403.1 PucR family transcriptional regulator [Clostridium sp. CT7]
MISCRNIVELPQLEQLKLVAGEGGLDRIILWAHVAESPQASNWVTNGALMLTTGNSIKEDNLLNLVRNISSKNLSGLIVSIGSCIKRVPKEVKDYANSINFPIFELPSEVDISKIVESICRATFVSEIEDKNTTEPMENLIRGKVEYSNEFLKNEFLYGYDINSSYTVIVVNIDKDKSNQKYDTNKIMEKGVNEVMHKFNKKILCTCKDDLYIIIMTILSNIKEETNLVVQELKNYISRNIPRVDIKIGCGRECSKKSEIYKSFNQAIFALKFLQINKEHDYMCFYDNLGVYRIFYEVQDKGELEDIYNDILGRLIDYDLKKNSNLVETLKAYLDEDGNLSKVSDKLFIHRNTLKYRIQKMQNIMNCSLKDANVRFNLFLAFKLKKFMNL